MLKLIWMCALSHLTLHVCAQQADPDFDRARQAAYQQHYTESKNSLSQLIDRSPSNADYIKLYANVYAWNQQFDSAIHIIQTVPNFSTDKEAQQMFCTYLFWDHQYHVALKQINLLIESDTTKTDPKLLELDILFATKQYQQCYTKARQLTPNKKVENLINNCAEILFSNAINVGYQIQFTDSSLIHLNTFSFAKSFKKYSASFMFSNALQQAKVASQYQVEVYRKWGKAGYTYCNGTISHSLKFPLYSLSCIHFLPTLKRVETDWGIRFYKSHDGYQSVVPSGGVTYSFDQLNINYRYYRIIGALSTGGSHSFSVCKFFNKSSHSIRLDVGIGNQFDRSSNPINDVVLARNGQSIGISYQRPLGNHVRIRFNLSEQQQRINHSNSKQFWLTGISFTYKFLTN